MKEILPTLTAGCSLSLPKTSRAATITKTSAQNRAREQADLPSRDRDGKGAPRTDLRMSAGVHNEQ